MLLRFGRFELDHACRELRLDGEAQSLQPQVFALLCYLARHRERVVGKDELLENVWPGSVVSESSLQKAVSLARSALRRGDAEHTIRTLPRQGYRFVAEAVEVGSVAPSIDEDETELAKSVQTLLAAGQRMEAVRVAIRLARLALDRLELSVTRGWALRAERMLEEDRGSREWAFVQSLFCRVALFAGEYERCLAQAEIVMERGRALADPDVEVLGLIDSGHASLALGDVARCVAHHDEAAALAMSNSLDPDIAGLVYCSVIWACHNRGDWARADEWTRSYTRWAEQNPVSYYPTLCRLHRAEVYRHQGDLESAQREIEDATPILDRVAPWAAGEAHSIFGQILFDLGDRVRAEAEFTRAYEFGWEPQPGYAWLLFVQGDPERALRSLRRAIESSSWGTVERRTFLHVEEVSLALACGRAELAAEALAAVRAGAAEADGTHSLRAEVARAEGEFALAEGRAVEAVRFLRAARDGWLAAGSPPNAARARVKLAEALQAVGDTEAAAIERAALRRTHLPMAAERNFRRR